MEKKDIENLAALSRLELESGEAELLSQEFSSILAYVAQIEKASKKGSPVETGQLNVMREDGEPHESGVYTEAILKNAPFSRDGFVAVKKIIQQ